MSFSGWNSQRDAERGQVPGPITGIEAEELVGEEVGFESLPPVDQETNPVDSTNKLNRERYSDTEQGHYSGRYDQGFSDNKYVEYDYDD